MSVDDFAVLAIVDPIGIVTTQSGMEIFGSQKMGVSVGLPVDCIWNGGSDPQAGVEIYHWEYPGFWLILSSQNDPLLGPHFHPPRVVNWRPHISMPTWSLDRISSCALRYRS